MTTMAISALSAIHETALGDLAADAFRVMMDADIGIMNGGGLRAPLKKAQHHT